MKLLYVTNHVSWGGGLERILAVKTNHLIEKYGYEIHIATFNAPPGEPFFSFHTKIRFHNTQLTGNTFKQLYQRITFINKLTKEISPDIIDICDDGLKAFLLPLFIRKKGVPVIYERHASRKIGLNGSNIISYILTGLLAPTFDRFVVLTKHNKNEWPSNTKTVIIPNAQTIERTDKSLTYQRKKRVISVGKICSEKGQDRLIEVWEKICGHTPEWQLHFFGPETDGGALRNSIINKGLSNSVFMHNFTENIKSEYEKASVYAMTSRSEGFGLVLIEAMNFGVPCIAYDCPAGPADIIKHGTTGYLIQDGNKESFAKHLLKLMHDDNCRQEFSTACIHEVKKYELTHIGKQWHDFFLSCIGEKAKH